MKRLPLLFCIFLLLVSSCKIGDEGDSKNTIHLGAVYNLTGSQSELDIPSSRGAQLRVAEINAQGGINGKMVKLILMDAPCGGYIFTITGNRRGQDENWAIARSSTRTAGSSMHAWPRSRCS